MATERAQQMAARCWCEPTTEKLELIPELAEVFAQRVDGYMGLIEAAWGIIASANWDECSAEWTDAATRWRASYHLLLDDKYTPAAARRTSV